MLYPVELRAQSCFTSEADYSCVPTVYFCTQKSRSKNGRIGIVDRPAEDFWPKGSEGWLPIAPDVLKELMRFRHLSTDDIIPGRTATEPKDAVHHGHSVWNGHRIKNRSKTSYELRRYPGSGVYQATHDILRVRDFLRHASVETTQQWYAYLLEDVPAIGMDDFVPAIRAAGPRA